MSYQWRFNGTNLSGATASQISLTGLAPEHQGVYFVVVGNASGSVTSAPAVLTVRVPPTMAAAPQSMVVDAGSHATFAVTAGGTPPFGYQWRFGSANLAGATDSNYTRSQIQYPEGEPYSVVVTIAAGRATSAPAVLTIRSRLTAAALTANGAVQLGYEGTPGLRYALEAAAPFGLSTWTSLITRTNATVATSYAGTNAGGTPRRFYRVKLAP